MTCVDEKAKKFELHPLPARGGDPWITTLRLVKDYDWRSDLFWQGPTWDSLNAEKWSRWATCCRRVELRRCTDAESSVERHLRCIWHVGLHYLLPFSQMTTEDRRRHVLSQDVAGTAACYASASKKRWREALCFSVFCRLLSVTVTETLVLRPLLEDRGRITESIRILVPVDRMKQKCFQITTKQFRQSQQFQLRR